ncbi:MAG: hypothetical protein FOGNACKC_00739 [Anaerolineae bacterium]|nr:hypothetical protein [Anaerolineae bacterium]
MYKKTSSPLVQRFLERVYLVERGGQQKEVALGAYLEEVKPYRKEWWRDESGVPVYVAWYRNGDGEIGLHIPPAVYYHLDLPECGQRIYQMLNRAVKAMSDMPPDLFESGGLRARRKDGKVVLTNMETGRGCSISLWQFAALRRLMLALPSGDDLIGQVITGVRELSEAELEDIYGDAYGVGQDLTVLELSDGSTLFAAQDPELNGPGALRQYKAGEVYYFS